MDVANFHLIDIELSRCCMSVDYVYTQGFFSKRQTLVHIVYRIAL